MYDLVLYSQITNSMDYGVLRMLTEQINEQEHPKVVIFSNNNRINKQKSNKNILLSFLFPNVVV